jgi:predicted NAD/FAD-dependent oxidoreductase
MVGVAKGEYQVPPPGWIRPACDRIAWMADNRIKGVSTSDRPAVTIHAHPEFSRLHYELG